jgi:hypothetical protein
LASIFLHLHELFVSHSVDIGVVWVVGWGHALGLFYRSLKQPLFFGLGLLSASTLVKCHHNHLALIHSVFDLAHVHGHLHLSHNTGLKISLSPSIRISRCSIPISVSGRNRHHTSFA